MRNRFTIALATSLLLLGAGCAPTEAPQEDTSEETSSAETAAPSTDMRSLATTIVLDETWQTYNNEALSFEFRWPTRGRYAPRWEVDILATNDASLTDGCVSGTDEERVLVGSTAFCHTVSEDGRTDVYAATIGSSVVTLAFTPSPLPANVEFIPEDYRTHLDQIVSTFRSTK
jgi:hypothetical protein